MLPDLTGDEALFLDFDGTLAEIVDDPEAVRVAPEAFRAIETLLARGWALAIVTGRPIATVDRVLAPLVLPVAGLHGLERRDAAGRLHAPAEVAAMTAFRARIASAAPEGLDVEDKGASLALHYRRRPELREKAEELVSNALAGLDGLHTVHGKMVLEIKPDVADKGVSVETFLSEPPFEGRRPVFVGDDVTDEDGFKAAARAGGYGVKVGEGGTCAAHRAADVAEVAAWLAAAAHS